jgi:oxygen-independent coproporphyrinogen III oxidase
MSESFGVYAHVPFCLSKCPYCDFASFLLPDLGLAKRNRLVRSLVDEMTLAVRDHPDLATRLLDSIYLGGGTPSLLAPEEVRSIVGGVLRIFLPRRHAGAEPDVETTLECNPAALFAEHLSRYLGAGVNRISLGVQSFDAEVLLSLGRRHTPEDSRNAIRQIREAGFASWGLDLIFGAPGTTLAQWEQDLDVAMEFRPPHLSIYGLTLHEGTVMHERHAQRLIALPDEETQREMFLAARRKLTAGGWEHYEISNYALPGYRSRHNSIYWTLGEYLGLGVAASSLWAGQRRANPASVDTYLDLVESGRYPARAEEAPLPRSRRAERIMLSLRQCEGVDLAVLNRQLGCDFRAEYEAEIRQMVKTGLLRLTPDKVGLTEEGILLSDSVFEAFF